MSARCFNGTFIGMSFPTLSFFFSFSSHTFKRDRGEGYFPEKNYAYSFSSEKKTLPPPGKSDLIGELLFFFL